MQDREIAYQQNLTGLKLAWKTRIDGLALLAVRGLARHADEIDSETLRDEAAESVTARLLKSERWANVTAVDISDLAYDAVVEAEIKHRHRHS